MAVIFDLLLITAFLVVPAGCVEGSRGPLLARAPPALARSAHITAAAPPPISGSFYRRPAKALERGGGFYVPGLEGDRLRIAVASLASVAIVANHLTSTQPVAAPQQTSEAIGAFFAVYTLVQAAVERAAASAADRAAEKREAKLDVADAPVEAVEEMLASGAGAKLGAQLANEFGWAARATLDSTRADSLILLSAGGALLASCARPGAGAMPAQLDAAAVALLRRTCAQPVAQRTGSAIAAGSELLAAAGGPAATQGAQSALLIGAGDEVALLALSTRAEAFAEDDARWLASVAALLGNAAAATAA